MVLTACTVCIESLAQGYPIRRPQLSDKMGATCVLQLVPAGREAGCAGVAALVCYLEDFQRVNGLPVPFTGAGVPLLQMYQNIVGVKLTLPSTNMRHDHGHGYGPVFAPCMLCTARRLCLGISLCLF